jgi:hypothetical protein
MVEGGRVVAIVAWGDLMGFLATKLDVQDPPTLTPA